MKMKSKTLLAAAVSLVAVAGLAMPLSVSAEDVAPSYKADPDVYKVIFEDANFRVIETNRKKGVHDKVHGHPVAFVVYNVTECKTKTYAADGKATETTRKAGTANAVPVIASHSAENVGKANCKQIFFEKK